MTRAEFLAFYPQFAGFEPAIVLNEYIALANRRFSDFGDDTGEARRLYTAHRLTMYAKTALPEGSIRNLNGRGDVTSVSTPFRLTSQPTELPPQAAVGCSPSSLSVLASTGSAQLKLSSKKVGEVSVSYSSETSPAATSLTDLTETTYGLQLLTLLRLHSLPVYVP